MADITTETLYDVDADILAAALDLMTTGLTAAEALIVAGATVYGTVTVETVEPAPEPSTRYQIVLNSGIIYLDGLTYEEAIEWQRYATSSAYLDAAIEVDHHNTGVKS